MFLHDSFCKSEKNKVFKVIKHRYLPIKKCFCQNNIRAAVPYKIELHIDFTHLTAQSEDTDTVYSKLRAEGLMDGETERPRDYRKVKKSFIVLNLKCL